jgi:HEAT repeat protein
MKRFVTISIILLAAGCKKEPTFEGRPKRYWIQELKSGSSTAAMRAAHAVGHFAPEATEAIPHLIKLLDDPGPLVRWAAADALGKFGPHARDAAPPLRKLATADPEAAVRAAAAWAVREIDPHQKENP